MLIDQVELPVSDTVEAAHFFGDILGLPTRARGGGVEVQVGPSLLLLHPGPLQPGVYHCAINIPAGSFTAAKTWLQNRVPLLERAGIDEFELGPPWNSQSLYFEGPDGILLELIARHDLPVSSSGHFGSADLLRLSEIGIAVPDVPAAVRALKERFALPEFGRAGSEFTPLGDHDGLLIVVQQGRPWFPTMTRAPSLGSLVVTLDTVSDAESVTLTEHCRVEPAGRVRTSSP